MQVVARPTESWPGPDPLPLEDVAVAAAAVRTRMIHRAGSPGGRVLAGGGCYRGAGAVVG